MAEVDLIQEIVDVSEDAFAQADAVEREYLEWLSAGQSAADAALAGVEQDLAAYYSGASDPAADLLATIGGELYGPTDALIARAAGITDSVLGESGVSSSGTVGQSTSCPTVPPVSSAAPGAGTSPVLGELGAGRPGALPLPPAAAGTTPGAAVRPPELAAACPPDTVPAPEPGDAIGVTQACAAQLVAPAGPIAEGQMQPLQYWLSDAADATATALRQWMGALAPPSWGAGGAIALANTWELGVTDAVEWPEE